MQNKWIENESIRVLSGSLEETRRIEALINSNDKEPSWDGAIIVYSSDEWTKDNIKCRLTVQVKGRYKEHKHREAIKERVSIVDLKNYLTDGGVLYFVVFVSKEGSKIYYLDLTPVRIKNVLLKYSGQKTVTLSFKEFPDNNDEKLEVMSSFYRNKQMQYSYSSVSIRNLEEILKDENLTKLSIPLSSSSRDSFEKMFLHQEEYYIYAHMKNQSIPEPVLDIWQNALLGKEIEGDVIVGKKKYYDRYKVLENKDFFILKIGESFTLTQNHSQNKLKVKYNPSNKLRVAKRDLAFQLDVIKHQSMEINGQIISLNYDINTLGNFDYKTESDRLELYQKSVRVLDVLGITKDLELSTLKPKDWYKLSILYDALILKKAIKINNVPPKIRVSKIAELRIYLVFEAHPTKENFFNIYDFFNYKIRDVVVEENGSFYPISQYVLMDSEKLLEAENLKLDTIISSLFSMEETEMKDQYINLFGLELLQAHDSLEKKKSKFLTVAIQLYEKLVAKDPTEVVFKQNLFQSYLRIRELNFDEKLFLTKIIDNENMSTELKIASYILLGEDLEAKKFLNKLPEEDQQEFKKYPIFNILET